MMILFRRVATSTLLLAAASFPLSCRCFVPILTSFVSERGSSRSKTTPCSTDSITTCRMASLDPVTFLRTEFVTAALFTNQIPRSADVCLQLGVYDGRALNFIPRTLRQFITSSLELDGTIQIGIQRACKQALTARSLADDALQIQYLDQRADNLTLTQDNSVDVVISMQSAEKMVENGLDWKRSVREAGRVLKPGGRFVFCEKTEIGEDNYLDFVGNLAIAPTATSTAAAVDEDDDDDDGFLLFENVGWDSVDFVVVPHVAGVFTKRVDAGLTKQERLAAEKQREQDMLAERSLSVFEQRRKGKKKKGSNEDTAAKEKPAVKK